MKTAAIVGLVAGLIVAIAILILACSGAPPTVQNAALAADVAAYTAESQDCVAGSANLAAYRNCIASVRARWCGPGGTLQQAGGCGDAGPDSGGFPLPASVAALFAKDAGTTTTGATGAAAVGATPTDAGGQ